MNEMNGTTPENDKAAAAAPNGAANGAGHVPVPAPAPAAPSRETASRDARAPFQGRGIALDRQARGDREAVSRVGDLEGNRLASTTRVINAVMGHLVNTCGREPDQLTEADTAALGQILATLDRLEVDPRRTRFAS